MRKWIIFAAWAGSLAMPLAASAQIRQVMDSVVVQDFRIPASISSNNRGIQVIEARDWEGLPVSSINDLLIHFSGIDLRQRGPGGVQADLSIDGSSFDQVLVLIDGVKVSDPQTGHHLLNLPVSLSSLERVEFIRGAAASQYGVNALAGVLNLVTRKPSTDGADLQVRAGGLVSGLENEGRGYRDGGLELGLEKVGTRLQHSLNLAGDFSNGYRPNTGYQNLRAFYQNRWQDDRGRKASFLAGFQDKDFGAHGFYSAPGDRNAREKTQAWLAAMDLKLGQGKTWTWNPRLSYRLHKDDYIYDRDHPERYRNQHQTQVITGEFHGSRYWGRGRLGLGMEYRQELIHSSNLGDHQRGNLGLFANIRQHWKAWDFSAGLYQQYQTQHGIQFYPSLDLGYHLLGSLKIYLHAGMGQRMPTYTDLYYQDPGNLGNENLRPERAYYGELGFRQKGLKHRFQVQAFFRDTKDFIDWVREDSSQPWQPLNYQRVQVPGLSMQGMLDLGRHAGRSASFHHQIHVQYTYLEPRIQDPDSRISKYVIEALRHQLQLRWQGAYGPHWRLSFSGRYQSRISMSDYWLLDSRLAYDRGTWSMAMDLQNLLDTQYRELSSVPLPGRWIRFTLGFRMR